MTNDRFLSIHELNLSIDLSMSRPLPSLTALRAFEAGARHLSFTRAAEELSVTQAAVSHQIRALERELGCSLFRRKTRRVELTEGGHRLAKVLGDSFDRIVEVCDSLRRSDGEQLLTVSLTHAFAGSWLVRRLGRFHSQHPEIDLRLHHSYEVVDFARDGIDMAIRWGRGQWPGLEVEFLKGELLAPVCAPQLLASGPPLKRPEDLRHHTLLHDFDYEDWTLWLREAGVEGVDPRQGTIIDDQNVVQQAALDGQGVALCDLNLLAEDLAGGRLLCLFEPRIETSHAYYITYPPGALRRAKVKALREFLLAEAAAEMADRGRVS